MKDWQRQYLKRFIIGMLGYVVLLPVSLLLIGDQRFNSTALSIVIVLSPVAPLIYAMSAVVGNVRHQDEMKRRIHLEAVLIAAFLTGSITFRCGLLEAAELVPNLPMMVVAPFMLITWGITNAIISRRYG